MEKDQLNKQSYERYRYDDRIELITILQVLWKWKWFIVGGTFLVAVVAVIISLQLAKVYKVTMVVRPGILRIEGNGKNTYIDSIANIKALVDAGTFESDMYDLIRSSNNDVPKRIIIKTRVRKDSDTLKIAYETADMAQGINLLNLLSDRLIERYDKLVDYYRRETDVSMQQKKTEIDGHKAGKKKFEQKIKEERGRIGELTTELKLITNNTDSLMKEREKFLTRNIDKDNILSALLYSNTIQQNLELSNAYKNEINDYRLRITEYQHKVEIANNAIKKLVDEIEYFKFKKSEIQNIQILQPPTSSLYPVKPKKMLIAALSTIVAFFLFVFLAFCIEYYRNVSVRSGRNE